MQSQESRAVIEYVSYIADEKGLFGNSFFYNIPYKMPNRLLSCDMLGDMSTENNSMHAENKH